MMQLTLYSHSIMLWDLLMLTYNISVLIQLTLTWEFYEISQWDCFSDKTV